MSKKPRPKTTLDCCNVKSEFVRYSVVKFKNGKFGIVDNVHYQLISVVDTSKQIDRNDFHTILLCGQTTQAIAKKLVKELNKASQDTQFSEIK